MFEADAVVGGISRTVSRGLPLRPWGPPLLHEGVPDAATSGEAMLGDEFLHARACRASITAANSFPTRSRRDDVVAGSASSSRHCCALSYLWSARAQRVPETLEDWVTARFGRRLYDAFFRGTRRRSGASRAREIQRRVGRAADQGLLARRAVLAMLGIRRAHDHHADRGVPVPAPRPRPDVGEIRARRGVARRSRPPQPTRLHELHHRERAGGDDRGRRAGG